MRQAEIQIQIPKKDLETYLNQIKRRVLAAQPGRERFKWLALQAAVEARMEKQS